MLRFDIVCGCTVCGCRKVLGHVELDDPVALERATSGYLCKACGHTAAGIVRRRWLEFDDPVHDVTLGSPISSVRVVVREPFREIWPYAADEVSLELLGGDLTRSTVTMSGNARRNMFRGIVEFPGLYVHSRGSYAIMASSPDHESIVSNGFEVR